MTDQEKHRKPEMTTCQKYAWEALLGQNNIFITGSAGTGKSFLLQQWLHKKNNKEYPVLASTGAAAILIGGRTFHSYFGLGIMQGTIDQVVEQALGSAALKKRLAEAQCIVIDEVSMLSGDTLYAANLIAKKVRKNDAPWGGLRIIAVGDFAQLPPVSRNTTIKDWAFLHRIWEQTGFEPIYLQTVVRTEETHLLQVLDDVRLGKITPLVQQFLYDRSIDESLEFDGTRLFAHRNSADAYNHKRLQEIPGQEYVSTTEYTGDKAAQERLRRNLPIPDQLHLKVHSLVMIRKNDLRFPYRYINGTLATVTDIQRDAIVVRLMDGKIVELPKQKFALYDGSGNEQAAASNFPITLAWATTIHKAQGATIDRLLVDLSVLWESGQAYVALSRVPSAAGLYITSWKPDSIKVDVAVQNFYTQLRS